jgi:hypothetical protein
LAIVAASAVIASIVVRRNPAAGSTEGTTFAQS